MNTPKFLRRKERRGEISEAEHEARLLKAAETFRARKAIAKFQILQFD